MVPGPVWRAGLLALACLHAAPAFAAPPPPPRVPPNGLQLERNTDALDLEPIGGGRLRHRDPRFDATIFPDGSVEFRDKVRAGEATVGGLDLLHRKFKDPRPLANDAIAEQALYPKGSPTAPTMIGFSGSMRGLSDFLLGTRHAAAKSKFLASTEPLRMRLYYAWTRQILRQQQDALIQQVIRAWRDPSQSLADRKRGLFHAWDECDAHTRGTPFDDLRADAAAEAQRKIEALARVLAPPGSPSQFTPAELTLFNRQRHSPRPFDPYRATE